MLGVLGGMGPMATIDFMAKVIRHTPANCDQDHVDMIVCSFATIPDRTAAIMGYGSDPLPAMLDALRRLERAGARCIAIPCNTAHHWHARLQAETRVPILHIVDAAADMLERRGVKRGAIGLLATDGTICSGVYQSRLAARGFQCLTPDAGEQADVRRAIRLVKAGMPGEAASILQGQAEALIARGCRQVAMACTEIPLALTGVEDSLQACLLDSTDALARACVDAYLPRARPSGDHHGNARSHDRHRRRALNDDPHHPRDGVRAPGRRPDVVHG